MRKNNLKNNNKGFSLVELIVVICIMAALIAIIGPQFMKFVNQSKVSADATQIEEVETTLKTIATEVTPNDYTVTIPSEEAFEGGERADAGDVEDLMAEYAGDNWKEKCYLKSADYESGATVTLSINPDTLQVTVNTVAN